MPPREAGELKLEDESLIRRYMLGDVSEDERTSIEKRLMTDSEYLGRLQLVETDLADDYASGALKGRERQQFERHFLTAPQHRERARVAAALRAYGAAKREIRTAPGRHPLFAWRLNPAAALALTVVTFVLAAATVVMVIQAGRLRNEIQRLEALSRDHESQLQALTRQAEAAGNERLQLEQQIAELTRSEEGELVLRDSGSNIMLDGTGNLLGLEAASANLQGAIKIALASGRVTLPQQVAELAGTTGVLMGSSKAVPFSLLSPVATAVVQQRPGFRWRELKGAVSYTVSVFDQDFRLIAKSEPLTKTGWLIPQSLDRGTTYSWQVTALKDGKEVVSPVRPAPEARFRVLDSAAVEEVERYRRSGTNSHLAAGVVYARAGLREEAEREFRTLMKENPDSAVARRLLRSVQR
jgi:hypothetical protein